jgi:endoglucanase
LLDAADALDARAPSYFGAAWIALARLWLDTDLLGGCRPGAPTRP